MKILHVISGVSIRSGGTSEVVPRMCSALKEVGHEVRLLTLQWGPISVAAEQARQTGVELILCTRDKFVFPRGLGYSADFARRCEDAVRWADVIHLHGLWQWPCWRAAKEAIRHGKPYVMQTHGFLEPERLKKSRFKKWVIGQLFERPYLSHAQRVIATAESEKRSIIAYGVKTPVEIVPIGIDTTDVDMAIRDDNLLDRLTGGMVQVGSDRLRKHVLLYFSRIAPIKGLDILADAWSELSEFHAQWQLIIAGPDDRGFSSKVKADFAAKVMDGSVSITGPVYGRDKFALLKSVDAFVLPTRSENFSIAVQEALAAGIPVVCTKGAPWKCIEENGCGYWVDISVDGVKTGLARLLSAASDTREQMGKNAKAYVKGAFSWSSVSKHVIGVYMKITNEQRCENE